jgi:hypothetical protein
MQLLSFKVEVSIFSQYCTLQLLLAVLYITLSSKSSTAWRRLNWKLKHLAVLGALHLVYVVCLCSLYIQNEWISHVKLTASVMGCSRKCVHSVIFLAWSPPLFNPSKTKRRLHNLALILLTWRIWWAPNNANRWQMGFNSAFKGLKPQSVPRCKHFSSRL